ncbi:MAG: IPTL-CTERM sorting domain-containing protein [Thermoanaerobaculia bacterium]
MSRSAEGTSCAATLLTQTTSQSIVSLNSVSCNLLGLHADNSYFRAFDMTPFASGFDVCEIQVGVEQAVGAGGVQPITVSVYANSGAAFPNGTLALLGTASPSVADQSLAVLTVPLAASVPAGTTQMVVEVFTPDGQAAGNSFFIGSNNLGESGPSYLEAADCGISVPTPTSSIGFANMQIVLNVGGDAAGGPPPPSVVEVPTLGGWGLALLVVILAAAAFVALRKRAVA